LEHSIATNIIMMIKPPLPNGIMKPHVSTTSEKPSHDVEHPARDVA
jgi:hypothetical protein